jgi:GntR family transcriptional regulator / MocR family aminotransferase
MDLSDRPVGGKGADFVLVVPPGETPLFARIAAAVVDDIRRGRLRPGDALPGSRTLAETLGVHRNTVLAATRELELEGWIEARHGQATRISTSLPDERAPRRSRAAAGLAVSPGYELGRAWCPAQSASPQPERKTHIRLLGGLPDLELVPRAALARAYRRVATQSRTSGLFGYADPRGDEVLREELTKLLARGRALAAGADDLLVTRGSQMALYLAARAVLSPGDRVAVEEVGYRPAWLALEAAGAKLVPVPVDRGGLDVEALETIARRMTVRAVYVTPHHQYPTTAVLEQPRRLALMALARERRIAIFEDDYDHEFHYEGRPMAPLASADPSGQVIYIGTLSKVLAPALRLGFVAAPRPVLERMTALRTVIDRQGDRVSERAVAELMIDGELDRHTRKMRRVYAARRDALAEALRRAFGDALTFDLPRGGMALWARTTKLDVDRWAAASEERGVVFQPASRFVFEKRRIPRSLRLGFAAEPEARLRLAVQKMLAAAAEQRGVRVL